MKYKKKQLKVMAIFIVTVLVILFSNKINIKNLRANIDANQNKFRNGETYPYSVDSNVIGTISNFNTAQKPLDSETNYLRSTLEYNKNEDFDILIDDLFGKDEITKIKNRYCYKQNTSECQLRIAQPRIIKTKSGKYILTFYTTLNQIYLNYNSGENKLSNIITGSIDVYYTVSSDLKNWTKPELLYESNYKDGAGVNSNSSNNTAYGYVFPFLLELSDGRIMALAAKRGIAKYAYATASAYNINGLYIRYGTMNGSSISWTAEEQIYKGNLYDPTAIEVSDDELQVYFTSISPVQYTQTDQASKMSNGEYYYTASSSLHNSSGVAMISMLKNKSTGKYVSTYTMPGDNLLQYNKTNTNPYVAYRIIQSYVATKANPNVPYNFDNGLYASNGKKVYGIRSNGKIIQMGDGMASPVILNNKTMVMPLETTYITDSKVSIGQTLGISLAYSNPTTININGQSKSKYWIDLSNTFLNNAKNRTYNNEKSVYSTSTGLGEVEVGPINRVIAANSGSGPDIVQFPSGETLLSYHFWPSFQMKIGDNTGHFVQESRDNGNIEEIKCYVDGTYNNEKLANQNLHKKISKNTYCAAINITDYGTTSEGGYDFGGIYVDNSHRVLAALAYVDSKGTHLKVSQYYLNHSIDSYSDGLSQKNDDALFIGSDSSAQETVRTYHDDDYLYFVLDRLDSSVSSADSNGLRIHSDALKLNGKKYNYIWVSSNNQKITRAVVGIEGNFEDISDMVSAKYVYADNGYKVIVKIKKQDESKKFYFIDDSTKRLELFAAITKGNVYDILEGAKESDMSTWIYVNLKEPKTKITIPSSPTDKSYTGNVQNHGITVPANTSVVSYGSTTSAKDVGEYIVNFKINDPENYVWSDGTSENKQVKWKIVQSTPKIFLTAKSTSYTGSAIESNPASTNITGLKIVYKYYSNNECTVATTTKTGAKNSGEAPVNAGTYYVKAISNETLNTKQASSSCVKLTINKKKLIIPTKIGDRIYTGSEQDSGIQCPEGSKSSGDLKGTKVKSYTQICTLSSTTNYVWSDGTTNPIKIEWKILSPEASYKVTFMSEGKELYSGYVSSGEKISRPAPNPTKDNYRFDDWYTDETFKTKFDFNTTIKQNVSVYAKFIEQVKITIDTNGGKNNGFETIAVDKGSTLKKSDIESKITLLVTPPAGKRFDYVTVNNEKWTEDTYAFNNNTVIKIIWKDAGVKYTILSGDNQTYEVDSSKDIVIKVDENLEKLIKVKLDGIEVNSSNYELKSGSTILTLKSNYLNTLEPGIHKVEFEYNDGYAEATLIVEKSDKTVKTVEKNNKIVLIVLLIIIILLIAGVVTYVYKKKHKTVQQQQ